MFRTKAVAEMGFSLEEERPPQAPARVGWLDRIGIPKSLAWGFVGLLLFMIGDGVEAGFLPPYLGTFDFSTRAVSLIFTSYGFCAAIAGWLSGALSDVWGPRRVIVIGLVVWASFHILFLVTAIPAGSYTAMLMTYGLRGFGYPLFAFG